MNALKHAEQMHFFNMFGAIVGAVFFLSVAGTLSSGQEGILAWIAWVIFLLISVLIAGVLWNRPVYCQTPGCSGVMTKTKTRISTFESKIQYRCPTCKALVESYIFELGSSGDPIP